MAFTDIRRAFAQASVSVLLVLLLTLMLGTDPPEDIIEARGGLIAFRLRLPTTRTAPTQSAPSRSEKKASSIRRSVDDDRLCASLQARRQDIVEYLQGPAQYLRDMVRTSQPASELDRMN